MPPEAKRLRPPTFSVIAHDRLVYVEMWADEESGCVRYALTPGEALELIGRLAPAAKRALTDSL
jgi:hypothetical protein